MTFEGIVSGLFVRISNIQHVIYEVNYNGRTSYVSSYFYYRIRPVGLLCDTERNLLAIAKVFVTQYRRVMDGSTDNFAMAVLRSALSVLC